jgi:hypothetical protein
MRGLFVLAIVLMVLAVIAAAVTLVASRVAKREKTKQEAQKALQEQQQAAGTYDRYSMHDDRRSRRAEDAQAVKHTAKIVTYVLVGLSLSLTLFSSFTVVSTKNVGIVTSFGRPVDSLSNGLHPIAPWEKVTELDAAIQTDNHYQDEKDTDCVQVRITRQAVACVDVSIRWRIKQESSDVLFKDYRTFDKIRDSLVTRELNATLNSVFSDYDPLGIDDNGEFTAPSGKDLSAQAVSQMQSEIGNQIDVLSVIIGVVHFDKNTQSRVDALQAQVAQTRIATQAVVTAQQQAAANRELAKSISNDPNVLVSRCYDLVAEMLNQGMTPPVAFSCWPGAGSSVVLPTAPAK